MGDNVNSTDIEKGHGRAYLEDEEKGAMDKEAQLGDHSGSNGSNLERATSNPTVPTGDYVAQDNSSDDTEDDEGTPSVIGRVMSRVTSRSSIDPGPPPDGGRLAWAQCKSSSAMPTTSP